MSSRGRKKADRDSVSSGSSVEDSPKKKGRGERLIADGRPHSTVGTAFMSGDFDLSSQLVNKVSSKACQFMVIYDDDHGDNSIYFGQGGLLRGSKIASTPSAVRVDRSSGNKRRRVSFSEYASYEATPVTAKHNLELAVDDRAYKRTTVKFLEGPEKDVIMPDGGCTMTNDIEVRPSTEDTAALLWAEGDVSVGTTMTDDSNSLTKKPRQYVKAPDSFRLQVGDKIGMAVFRTFDITHADAKAPAAVDLVEVFGRKNQVCIYTGEVTEVSANGKTFCHSINTFEGCSGSVIFLLDEGQGARVLEILVLVSEGMAVGIHVGGLDDANNLAFTLNE